VTPVDDFASLFVGQGPGHRHALRGAERQVKTTHGLRARGPAEYLAGDWIGAVLEHPLEVLRGDGLSNCDTATIVETDESGSEKDPRGSASFTVVANEIRPVGAFGTVANSDGFEQVLVARSDAESSNRHHGVDKSSRNRPLDGATVSQCQTCEHNP